MRDRRKIISLDTDSALALMQEIYNDIVEQKNIASLIIKKMSTFMKDAEDMPVIGSVIDKQQKILQDCSGKKLDLVKLQTALLKQSGPDKGGNKQFSQMQLSEEDRQLLNKMIDEKDDKASGEENDDEKYKT